MRKSIALCVAPILMALLAQAARIPSGNNVNVRLGQTISSDKARCGDTWNGTLADDVAANGRVVARRGDPVTGRVVDAKASGRLSGTADIELQLTSINGTPVITSTVGSTGKGHKGRNAKAIGGGAAAGAIIGALAGRGKGPPRWERARGAAGEPRRGPHAH